MLHYPQANKNKHQHDYKMLPEQYLYKNHKVAKNLPKHLSPETRAELNDDIFFMRRHFKHTVRKLKRNIYYTDWLKDASEMDGFNERMRLRSKHA